jgi:prevent-host-death family protein
MTTIGVRALKQNASAIVARAEAGEVLTITDRGRPVAQLVPLRGSTADNLVVAGRLRPARRSITELGSVPKRRRGPTSISAALDEMRDAERY